MRYGDYQEVETSLKYLCSCGHVYLPKAHVSEADLCNLRRSFLRSCGPVDRRYADRRAEPRNAIRPVDVERTLFSDYKKISQQVMTFPMSKAKRQLNLNNLKLRAVYRCRHQRPHARQRFGPNARPTAPFKALFAYKKLILKLRL